MGPCSAYINTLQAFTDISGSASEVGTHLDLDELGEAEDDGEEDCGGDVVHCADDGGAVRREGLVAQRVAHRDVPSERRKKPSMTLS